LHFVVRIVELKFECIGFEKVNGWMRCRSNYNRNINLLNATAEK